MGSGMSSEKEHLVFTHLKGEYEKALAKDKTDLDVYRHLKDEFRQITVEPPHRHRQMSGKAMKNRKKNRQVFHKGLRMSQLRNSKGAASHLPNVTKDEESIVFIKQALSKGLLEGASEQKIDVVMNAMNKREFSPDVDVIKQGETGQEFYVCAKGELTVLVDGKIVASLGPGDSFGELSLIYDCPTSANIKTKTGVLLWSLSQDMFRDIQHIESTNTLVQRAQWLKNVSIFKELAAPQLARISHTLEVVDFNDKEQIVKQGAVGDSFYILQEGEVACYISDARRSSMEIRKNSSLRELGATVDGQKGASSGGPKEVDRMKPGDYFGEAALIKHEPRNATCVAVGPVRCLVMQSKEFHQVMGSISELLEHNSMVHALQNVSLFKDIPKPSIEQLVQQCEVEKFEAGQCLVNAKSVSPGLFIVKDGTVHCMDEKGQVEAEITHGRTFGEGGLMPQPEAEMFEMVAAGAVECMLLSPEAYHKVAAAYTVGDAHVPPSRRGSGTMCSGPMSRIPFAKLKRLRLLGEGSFGQVTLVEAPHPDTGDIEVLALKRMCKQHIVDSGQQEHINSERKILSSLPPHPFVLHLYATYQDMDCVYMLTNVLLGGELFSLIHKDDGSYPLSIDATRFYAANVFLALEHLHLAGYIYRDMKPENILLGEQGYLCLIDMGFAKQVPFEIEVNGEVLHQHVTYTMCGTPEYMAPEFILQTGHNAAADYWALGILVFEMFCARTPFLPDDEDMGQLFKNIARQVRGKSKRGKGGSRPPDIHFPSSLKKRCPAGVDIVTHLLNGSPVHRLGMLRKGTKDIRNHAFFKTINWDTLLSRKMPVPWKPDKDADNFDPEEPCLEFTQYLEGDDGIFKDF